MHITAFGGGRQHGAARFGLITVLSPTVRQAVEAELRMLRAQLEPLGKVVLMP